MSGRRRAPVLLAVACVSVLVLVGAVAPASASPPPTTRYVLVGPDGSPVFSPRHVHARLGDTVE